MARRRTRRRSSARRRKNPDTVDVLVLGALGLAAAGAVWYFWIRKPEEPTKPGGSVVVTPGQNLPTGGGAQLPQPGAGGGGGGSIFDGIGLPPWMAPGPDDNQGA